MQLGIGQWGMFCGPEGKQLVIVDGEPCGPVSARKLLTEVPRRLLLDAERVVRALSSNEESRSEVVDHAGQQLRVVTRRVVSPWSKTPLGVFAGVFPADIEVPEPPLVGSWEWVITMDGNEVTGRRTFWNHDLFELYEVDSSASQQASGYWEVDVWGGELVAESDQLRFFTSLRDGYWDNWTGVRCATFDAIAGYGTQERRRKHLRLVAQMGAMSTTETLVFQGFSYQVPEVFSDRALAEEYPTDNALRGFMSLVDDPMAIVDPFSLEVLMSTPAWRHESFGRARSLKEILDEDPSRVRDFLVDAADRGSEPTSGVMLVREQGTARTHGVIVVGMDRGPARDALAIVRLKG